MSDKGLLIMILLCVMAAAGGIYAGDVITESLGWGSAESHFNTAPKILDLPINVTRIIHQEDTTFIYQARGDEESILFSGLGESRVVKDPIGNVIEVFATKDLKLWADAAKRPALEILIIRDNGTRETYSLLTRGGEVHP